MSTMCQICMEAKATVHISDMAPTKRDRHLCEDCAEREGIIVKSHHTTSEILQQFIKQKVGLATGEEFKCDGCGMTFRDFQTKGQLGCPQCYSALAPMLMPLIERAHEGHASHVGKAPMTAEPTIRRQVGLLRLRRELEEALEGENYEQAARVRDEIEALESQ